jgi:DNA-directed RNA polymerase subunit L
MQRVSKAYKESMKSSLRERAYIMISFGLVNQEAQAKAKIEKGEFAYYTNTENIFGEKSDDTIYATLEENFTKVDGSMFFLPRKNISNSYLDTGLISEKLVSQAIFELTINLNIVATDFKGITINFGENYPVDFDMVSSSGQVIQFRNNTAAVFTTEEVLTNTTQVKLVVYRMKNPQSRLRIYSIRFGYGLVYYNDSVMSSSLESYVSPIGADIPQIDFSVTLKNYDKYFNVDNPKSAINFLETGQEMDIYYGYQLPNSDEIEWVRGNHLLCSEWESDDYTATIRCQDIFRNMDGEYVKGLYSAAGKSYYALAEEILKDAGISEYYIDPRLKKLYSNNPIPRVKYKEALQIIANACRCVLTQSRDGKVQIKSNFMPSASIATNGEETYSNAANVLTDTPKVEYATLAGNYTPTDGTMFFLPRNGKAALTTGYVSKEISGANGTFTKNPIVTITMEAIRAYYGLKLVFGTALPAAFTIRTYKGGEPVNEYPVEKDEINTTSIILRDFDDFDVMKIEFTKTAEPYNRIVLNYFSLSDVVDFTMNRRDMTSSPKAIKQELIKEVIVPCYTYQENNREENLVYEDIDVIAGEVETYYIQDPSYGYKVKLDEVEGKATVVAWSNYFVTIKFNVTGSFKLEVQGYRYKIVEKYATVSLNARGKTVKWKNPLISNTTMANELAAWLADYYTAGIEYEYDTRGNPELDATDIVYQENEFHDGMRVNIYRYTVNFKQAFSGRVTARRIGG